MAAHDTSPDSLKQQRDAFRRMSPSERLRAAAEMSESVRDLAEAGIRRRHPGMSDAEVRAALVRLLLGPDSPDRLDRS